MRNGDNIEGAKGDSVLNKAGRGLFERPPCSNSRPSHEKPHPVTAGCGPRFTEEVQGRHGVGGARREHRWGPVALMGPALTG